jgi:hypothetical protein
MFRALRNWTREPGVGQIADKSEWLSAKTRLRLTMAQSRGSEGQWREANAESSSLSPDERDLILMLGHIRGVTDGTRIAHRLCVPLGSGSVR